jgi:DNA-directed RNA polymerase subunit M/transcription elongation factor TFIIS
MVSPAVNQSPVPSSEDEGGVPADDQQKQPILGKRHKQDLPDSRAQYDELPSGNQRATVSRPAAAGYKKILNCDQCDERFTESSGLALHKLSAHKDEEDSSESPKRRRTANGTAPLSDKFKCGECGQRFPKFALLLKHLEDVPNCSNADGN